MIAHHVNEADNDHGALFEAVGDKDADRHAQQQANRSSEGSSLDDRGRQLPEELGRVQAERRPRAGAGEEQQQGGEKDHERAVTEDLDQVADEAGGERAGGVDDSVQARQCAQGAEAGDERRSERDGGANPAERGVAGAVEQALRATEEHHQAKSEAGEGPHRAEEEAGGDDVGALGVVVGEFRPQADVGQEEHRVGNAQRDGYHRHKGEQRPTRQAGRDRKEQAERGGQRQGAGQHERVAAAKAGPGVVAERADQRIAERIDDLGDEQGEAGEAVGKTADGGEIEEQEHRQGCLGDAIGDRAAAIEGLEAEAERPAA